MSILEEPRARGAALPTSGKFTTDYPELGTGLVNYEDCISPEFYELEREAVFKRAWLMVGRVDQLPRRGSYVTKEIAVANTSVLIVRGMDDEIRAFHNVCRHRGNKLVWNEYPDRETSGSCRQFMCKYHGWKYDLDGACTDIFIEDSFFDIDKADYGLPPVHCEVWQGFIFINLDKTPRQPLREFLGPLLQGVEGYPFNEHTERYRYRANIKANWKLFYDAFQEFYHGPILHGSLSPNATPEAQLSTLRNPYYEISPPHRLMQPSPPMGPVAASRGIEFLRPIEQLTKATLIGPLEGRDFTDTAPRLNPSGSDRWMIASYQVFPNSTILFRGTGWFLTYSYWPTSYNTCVFEGNLYFPPSKDIRERIAHEVARVTHKEFALQDANTLQGTQMGLESRAVSEYPLGDHEILCRHFHQEIVAWVERYKAEREAMSNGHGNGARG